MRYREIVKASIPLDLASLCGHIVTAASMCVGNRWPCLQWHHVYAVMTMEMLKMYLVFFSVQYEWLRTCYQLPSYWPRCEVKRQFVTGLIVIDYLRGRLLKCKCSEGSWEHGQQSRSLKQSTESSVVNLNPRLNMETKCFLGYPTMFSKLPCTSSSLAFIHICPICTHFLLSLLPPMSSEGIYLAQMTWTMGPLPRSC